VEASEPHNSRDALDDNVQHRLKSVRRAADHLQHIRCRGLELQGFREIAGFGLHFLEQADIANGDYRLIGEGLKQFDLLVAERMHLGATQRDGSNTLALTRQGYA
jgi:hypothetical protein